MKYLTRITGMLLLLAGVAGAQIKPERYDMPISGVIRDCEFITDNPREPVAFDGVVHVSSEDVRIGDTIFREFRYQSKGDLKAVGLDTGRQYNVIWDQRIKFSFNNDILGISSLYKFKIGNLYDVHAHAKSEWDESGTTLLKNIIERYEVKCR